LTYNIRPLVSTAPDVVEFVNLESTEKKDNPAQILKNYSISKIREPFNKYETKILSIAW
jgi:translation elongation factor EF-4